MDGVIDQAISGSSGSPPLHDVLLSAASATASVAGEGADLPQKHMLSPTDLDLRAPPHRENSAHDDDITTTAARLAQRC